ncbi:RHS repeat-associated core domain-containing protein [Treponema sp. OMZ 840]|uniref:RHS repeat domain-containing protein n=1 Tax=Treponema sp. OMZ 840 TaxID=244313 RepID=UPI003D935253
MAENTRVFSDATQSSPSGCKNSMARLTTGSRATWALVNEEKIQQNSHGLFQRKYAWNEKNLLKESSDSRHTVFYRYGADGQRAVKSSEQSETLYFNTMWSWIHNSSAYNTDREIKHIYLGSERLVTRTNGAGSDGHTSTAEASTYYYHSDHLGSAHLITDYKGDEYERIEYTPYGEYWIEKRAPENRTLPFKFTGKERDEETGLYYYGARYLDAKTSRWLTTDPALEEYMAGSSVGEGGIYNQVNFNLYHYAGNNPIKYTDPTGRAYTFQVAEQEYWFSSDLCVLDKVFDDFMGLIPYSSLSKKLFNATSALNRIDETSNIEILKSTGNDFALSMMDMSDNRYLKSFGKALNKINIAKTLYTAVKDLLNNQTVGREQFIENEFSNVLKGTSRKNVELLYAYAKKHIDDFIDCGYITLDIDKKGVLKSYKINNQYAVDRLYCDLKNLQLKLNLGSPNE